MAEHPNWIVCIKGGVSARFSEIAIVRSDNIEGIQSFGHFNDKKFLIAQNGGCMTAPGAASGRKIMWPITQIVWDKLLKVAHELADEFNAYDT